MTSLDVGTAATFPEWSVLNNAIVDRRAKVADAGKRLRAFYSDAGIGNWALWLASSASDFVAADLLDELPGFRRDTTTLVMQAAISERRHFDTRIVRTSIATATRASEDPVPRIQLDEPAAGDEVEGWVLVEDDLAVSGAWSLIHDGDCGIYSVGTVSRWRRRGYARALVEGILDDAFRREASTSSLQSTREAQSLYAAVGFRPAGRYEEWIPVDS